MGCENCDWGCPVGAPVTYGCGAAPVYCEKHYSELLNQLLAFWFMGMGHAIRARHAHNPNCPRCVALDHDHDPECGWS